MNDAERAEVFHRIDALSDKLDLHTDVDLQAHAEAAESRKEVLALVTETRDSVAGLVEVWDSLKGLSKVLSWIGTFIKWGGTIVLTIGGLWALLKARGNG